MKRTIVKIDETLCNGCGECITKCHEGALQLINGKAVLISDVYCDGLGKCIGECPVGAITLEEREAESYDEKTIIKHILEKEEPLACGCPGSMMREIKSGHDVSPEMKPSFARPSELRQFPVQLHLLNPRAGFLKGANLLLAADCTAFSSGEFHSRFLKSKMLAIACPKLDSDTQSYISKITEMIDVAQIDTLTVLIMEVPCCGGLTNIAKVAREHAKRHIPIKIIVLSVEGNVLSENWI